MRVKTKAPKRTNPAWLVTPLLVALLNPSNLLAQAISNSSKLLSANQTNTSGATVDGGGGGGYVITSDSAVSVTNGTYTNYFTQGGAGSGGGAGLGGVFFIDQGSSLILNNVSFAGNVVKGGTGGSLPTDVIQNIAINLTNIDVNTTAITSANVTPTIVQSGGNYVITGATLPSTNGLLASNAAISFGSNMTGSIGSVSGTTVTLGGNITVDSKSIETFSTSSVSGNVATVATNTYTNVAPGMEVFGGNLPAGTTVVSTTTDSGGNVTSMTLSNAPTGNAPLTVIAINSFTASRFYAVNASGSNATQFKPTTSLPGLIVGMQVTGTNIPSGTTITAIGSDGTVTFSQAVPATITSFDASLPAAASGSNVITLPNVATGLKVGMTVTFDGTQETITKIGNGSNGLASNQITLSGNVSAQQASDVQSGSVVLSANPVLSTSAGNVTLSTVAGLKVGAILSGPGIPTDAVITSISATTGVVSFSVRSGASALSTGGTLNGMSATGSVGSNGSGGLNGTLFNALLNDGEGSPGTNGANAGNGNGAAGGVGGAGGSGSNAVPYNYGLMLSTASDTISAIKDTAEFAADVGTFPVPLFTKASVDAAGMVTDWINVGTDLANWIYWNVELSKGTVALGGAGGNGGSGGNGTDFFGGGAGGAGGNGGAGALSQSQGGPGGSGGSGGSGGFGAGGGSGGAGGNAGAGANAEPGSGGSGGSGGFGAGAGTSGDGSGGGGGSGYGGAVFVRNGASLTVTGNSVFFNNSSLGGSSNNGGAAGSAAGSDLFMMTGSTVTFSPGLNNTITFYGTIADDSASSIGSASYAAGEGASVQITGGGLVQFLGSNTYSGSTMIGGATLEATDGVGINADSHILFNGTGNLSNGMSSTDVGVLLTSGTFTRMVGTVLPTEVSWTESNGSGGSGGFAADGGNLTLNFGALPYGNKGQTLVWNSGGFVPAGSTLVFGSDYGNGMVTLLNDVNLNKQNGQIASYASANESEVLLSGTFSNGNLTVNGPGYSGTVYMTAQNTLNGLTLNNGTLQTSYNGTSGRLMDPTAGGYLTINGGTADLQSAEKITSLTIASGGTVNAYQGGNIGTINNSGNLTFFDPPVATLTAGTVTNSGNLSIAIPAALGDITNTGNITLNVAAGNVTTTGNITNTGVGSQGNLTGGIVYEYTDIQSSGWVNNTGLFVLGANLTAASTVTNNGELLVLGNVTSGSETAATRTINTTGLSGNLGSVVQLGGLSGNVANSLIVNQSGNSTDASSFVGAGSLTKTGAGDLTLTGASTFTGNLNVAAGTLDTTGGGTFANTVNVTVNSGATYTVGTSNQINSLTNSGTVNVNGNISFVSGNGATTNNAGGVINLNAPSSTGLYSLSNSGSVNVSGTLVVATNTSNTAGANLTLQGGSNSTFDGNVTNTGLITLQAGSTNLIDGNLVNGTVPSGNMPGTINAAAALTVLGSYTQNTGTLTTTKALTTGSLSGTGAGAITLNGPSAVFTITQSGNGTYDGSITGSGNVVVSGNSTATLTLDGVAGSLAPTQLTVNGGTVLINGTGIMGGNLNSVINTGGTLTVAAPSGNVTNVQTTGNITNSGTVNLFAATNAATITNNAVTSGGNLTGGLMVTTANVTATGPVSNSGLFELGGNLSTPSTVTNNGLLSVMGSGTGAATAATRTINTQGFSGNSSGVVNLGGLSSNVANTLVINQSGNSTYAGVFTGVGALTKTGLGDLNLTGNSSSSGNVTVAAGTLDTTGGGKFASSVNATVNAGATYIVGTSDGIMSLTNSGTVNVSSGVIFTSGNGATTNNAGGVVNLSAGSSTGLYTLNNSGNVNSAGNLTVTTGASNNLGGNLTMQAGSNNNFNANLTNAGTITNGGTLQVAQNANNTGLITLQSASSNTFGSVTNAGTITNGGSLQVLNNVNNTGLITLQLGSGNNTFGSLTNGTVPNGNLTAPGTINASANLTVTGAYIQNTGNLTTTKALNTGSLSGTGAGAVTLNGPSAVFTINQTGNGTYDGSITGNGSVVKNGSATLTLDGAANSLAPTSLTVNAGGVTISGAGIMGGNLTSQVNVGGTLTVASGTQNTGNITNSGTLNVNSQLTAANLTNTAVFSGPNLVGGLVATTADVFSNGIVSNAGLFQLGGNLSAVGNVTNTGDLTVVGTLSGGTETAATRTINTTAFVGGAGSLVQLGGLSGNVANTLVINQSGTSTDAGSFIGAGALVKSGNGTLNLTGANTFTGGLTVAAGTLATSGNGTFANTLAVTVDAGANLSIGTTDAIGSLNNMGNMTSNAPFTMGTLTNSGILNSNSTTPSGNFTVSGNATNLAGGTLNLNSGSVDNFGGMLTNGGTINATGALFNVAGNVNNTSVINLVPTTQTNFSGSLTNSGSITAGLNAAPLYIGGSLTNNGSITTSSPLMSGSLSGNGSIALNNSVTYSLNQTSNSTYTGNVSGTGTVLVTSASVGTLTLAGAPGSFAPANLQINAGGVAVNGAGILGGNLNVDILQAGALTLLSGNQSINTLNGNGTVNLDGNSLNVTNGGVFTGAVTGNGAVSSVGNLTLQNLTSSAPLSINGGNTTVQTGSTVSTTGLLTVSGNGTVMNAAGSVLASGVLVNNGGTLHLGNGFDTGNGSVGGNVTTGNTSVTGGGSVTGIGGVSGNTTVGSTSGPATQGTVAPGNSLGILTFGNLTLANGSSSVMQIDGTAGPGVTNGNDQVIVTGALSLQAGSTLTIQPYLQPGVSLAMGSKVNLFSFAPGAVSGNFGTVTNGLPASNLIFNIATGNVVGLGSSTTQQFVAAASNTPNETAIMKALMVNNTGGVNQYYGGRLMEYVTSALNSGGGTAAVNTAFALWSPEAYTGLMDQMQFTTLNNLPELGGYGALVDAKVTDYGYINRKGQNGKQQDGYVQNTFADTSVNVGSSYQTKRAQFQLSYIHDDGNVSSALMSGSATGDTLGLGVSMPFALGDDLRATARLMYGSYQMNGVRSTNAGTAAFSSVGASTSTYGLGLEYLHDYGGLKVDATSEILALQQDVSGFRENGVSVLDAMRVNEQSSFNYYFKGDVRMGSMLNEQTLGYVKAGVIQRMDSNMHNLTANVVSENTSFTVQNPGLATTQYSLGLGAQMQLQKDTTFTVDAIGGSDGSYNLDLGFKYTFK